MKRISMPVILVLLFAIFIFCFTLGKINATRSIEKYEKTKTKTEVEKKDEEIFLPASESLENVEKPKKVEEKKTLTEEKTSTEEKTPPERMLFPCGQTILKDYSQQAIYSKTTDDWRAHTGIDYKADIGNDVVSVWDGVVKNSYSDSLWGITVEIEHDGEIISIYKNLDENIFVQKGDKVKKGQVIGKVGSSAGIEKRDEPHLHFELWSDGMSINPNSYIY